MDTGKGKFETVEPGISSELPDLMKAMEAKHPDHGGWFHVGEEVVLKGRQFCIKAVKPTELRIKLVDKRAYNHGIFDVGEAVELNGSHFRVKAVKLKVLRLKLLPKSQRGT